MITRITIPQAFENMEEATIGAWLKSQGDAITRGSALCELITEKTTFQLEAEGEGVLRLVAASEKSIVPVGAIIGIIADENEALPDIESENAALRARVFETQTSDAKIPAPIIAAPRMSTHAGAESASSGARVRATPAARRAAKERGVSLEEIALSLPGKVISEEDVNSFQQT